MMNKKKCQNNSFTSALIVAILSLLIVSCSSAKKSKTVKKPELIDTVQVTLSGSTDVNPNDKQIANPVRVLIYQLKHSEKFNDSDFFTLVDQTDSELNAEAKKYYDTILIPDEEKTITVSADKDTIALGFVAAYRDISHAEWKKVFLLPEKPKEKWYTTAIWPWQRDETYQEEIKVNFERLTISIKKMD